MADSRGPDAKLPTGRIGARGEGESFGWQQKRDFVRSIIRTEVERAGPIDEARRSIELIAETSVRSVERNGQMMLVVVDDEGQPRTVAEGGAPRDFTVRDLVQELRAKHPKLFQPHGSEGGAERQAEDGRHGSDFARTISDAETVENPPAVAVPQERDWLDLGSPALSRRESLNSRLQELDRTRLRQPPPQQDREEVRPPSFSGFALNVPDEGRPQIERGPPIDPLFVPPESRSGGLRRVVGIVSVLFLLIGASYVAYSAYPMLLADRSGRESEQDVATSVPAPSSDSTSSLPAEPRVDAPPANDPPAASTAPPAPANTAAAPAEAAPKPAGPLKGIPEILDTATLFLQGKIVPLYGVEWVRGAGSPEDLARYINGREVVCEDAPTPGTYRCKTDTQDLSKVVLYNGGGRARPDATPELKAAEDAARTARRGMWASNLGSAQQQ